MNRKLKFRFWDTKKHIWLKNRVIHDGKAVAIIQQNVVRGQGDNGLEPALSNFYGEITYEENCIIQQFTGLKDKNSTEIYEGDILRNDVLSFYKVVWDGQGFYICDATVQYPNNQWLFSKRGIENSIIIGNILENPEL